MEISEYNNIYKNELTHFFYIGTHLLVLELVKRYANKPFSYILDAGCGTGLLAKKLSIFGDVTGVDYNSEAIKLSQKRGINAIFGSVTKLPFKNNCFDLVISIDVLYHSGVESDQKALDEFFRVLKPNGILILKVPAFDWIRGKHDLVVQTKHRYTTTELSKKLERSKFRIEKLTYTSLFLLPLAIAKRFLEFFQRRKGVNSDVNPVPFAINTLLIIFYKIEIFLLKFINLPFGLSVLAVAQKP